MATNDQKNQARAKREAAAAAAAAAQKRSRNIQILGGLLAAALVVVIGVVLISGGKDTPEQGAADGNAVEGVAQTKTLFAGLQQNGFALGDPKAPATIVEFIDVQCPFCRDHQLDEQPRVIKELVRTGKARLIAQPIALPQMGEDSEAGRTVAARLALTGKGWNFLNLFYLNQGEEATGYVTDAYLKKLVAAIPGTNPAEAAREPEAKVKAELDKIDKLASDLGVTGTPSFAVGATSKPLSSYKLLTLNQTETSGEQLIKAADAVAGS